VNQPDSNIQFDSLRALVDGQTPVWVFLVSGIKLAGVIGSFDKYVISFRSPAVTQTIFKSAVATVITQYASVPKPADEDRAARSERRVRTFRHR